jgi:hypothetical protein
MTSNIHQNIKKSILRILSSWGILLPIVDSLFGQLKAKRHRAIHFDPATDANDRILALEATKILHQIIEEQFEVFASKPWFIPGFDKEKYIKKEKESDPFIRRIYLPCCALVGPNHNLVYDRGMWKVQDDDPYENKEISDEEYIALRVTRLKGV